MKAVWHDDPTRGSTLAELIVKRFHSTNITTRWVYAEIIQKRLAELTT